MACNLAKVSEEEIVAINKAAFFYPSDLVNLIHLILVIFIHLIWRREVDIYLDTRYISTTIQLSFGG